MDNEIRDVIELLTIRNNTPIAKDILPAIGWGSLYAIAGSSVLIFFWWLISELVSGIV